MTKTAVEIVRELLERRGPLTLVQVTAITKMRNVTARLAIARLRSDDEVVTENFNKQRRHRVLTVQERNDRVARKRCLLAEIWHGVGLREAA